MGLGQERGYAMAALLVGLSVLAVLMSMALPVWSQYARREKEEELIWRGQQYARAIGLFQRKFANTFPPNVDILVEQRFLRKKYTDPITGEDFQLIPVTGGVPPGSTQAPGPAPGSPGNQSAGVTQPPSGQTTLRPFGVADPQPAIGIQGVVSKSRDTSIKVYNGRTKYNEWMFVHVATTARLAPGQGGQQPGGPAGVSGPGGFGPTAPGRPPVPVGTGQDAPRGGSPFGQPQPPFGRPAIGQPGADQPNPIPPPPPRRPPG